MEEKGKAFVKGGFGCLGASVVLALIAVLTGGSAHLNFLGIILLFVIGGLIGLVVNWIYQKGRHDAYEYDEDEIE